MKRNSKRRNYFELTFKEKQMVNNIMLKQEGYFNVFNISIMIVSALCMLVSISQNNLVLVLVISLIMFLVLRFKLFYYYLKHTEINFDIDSKENKEISKYTDNQTNLIFGIFGIFAISMFIVILGICGVFDNNDSSGSSDNGYHTKCTTRPDGKRCCTSCKKTSYGDVGCYTTCN